MKGETDAIRFYEGYMVMIMLLTVIHLNLLSHKRKIISKPNSHFFKVIAVPKLWPLLYLIGTFYIMTRSF